MLSIGVVSMTRMMRRRRRSTASAVCLLLVATQLVGPAVLMGHHHHGASGHAGAAQAEERGAADRPFTRTLRDTPTSASVECHLADLIVQTQPTLLVTTELTARADVPAVGRVGAAVAHRPVGCVLTGAMPRAPPRVTSL